MNHKHIPGDDSLKKQKLLNVIAYDSVLSHVVSTITKILTKKKKKLKCLYLSSFNRSTIVRNNELWGI
jgi:hypothetical protein